LGPDVGSYHFSRTEAPCLSDVRSLAGVARQHHQRGKVSAYPEALIYLGVKLWHDARRFGRQTRQPGFQDGVLGRNGHALHALLFDFLNYRSGALYPSWAAIATKACISERSVGRGLGQAQGAKTHRPSAHRHAPRSPNAIDTDLLNTLAAITAQGAGFRSLRDAWAAGGAMASASSPFGARSSNSGGMWRSAPFLEDRLHRRQIERFVG
jgi:hypothetical protein